MTQRITSIQEMQQLARQFHREAQVNRFCTDNGSVT